jgi:hyperosmotically inducible periplasmic protein
MAKILSALFAGAGTAFFLDPHSGRRRRHVARDKLAALLRRGSRRAAQRMRYAEGVAKGVVHNASKAAVGGKSSELDDATLTNKVESQIFRDRDAPKGDVDVNIEGGVVYLRGQVKNADQIRELVEAASRVDGVTAVENLLHLPGGPTRSKGGDRRTKAMG